MRKIYPLSEEIVAKIAAGEVIERPVYAVKELIENALDANADSISVHIEESGLKKITVIDNGEGMSREDLEECFKLHTTSKISSEEQLSHIPTLGFRGEALSSIAAISHMILQSRIRNEAAGTAIEIIDGKVENISPVGMPPGTTVTVADLFHSVPGRKKFLKSSRTEFRHIVELVTQMALVYPDVSFLLTHNKKKVIDLPRNVIPAEAGIQQIDSRLRGNDKFKNDQQLLERIKLLVGTKIFSNLLPLTYEQSYIQISGFLTTPQAASSSSHKQYVYINQRKVTDKLISLAVKDAYGTLIESKSQPVFILFLSLPYELVDVNVHPRKEQVRFVDHKLLYDIVYKTVVETLAKHNLFYYADNITGIALSDEPKFRITNSFAGRILKENQIPWDIRKMQELTAASDITQFHHLYLVMQTKFGIALVDQHAAHERILYEQFLEAFKKQKRDQPQYHLPKPAIFDLTFSESELLQEHLALFEQGGFTIEHFRDNSFLLHAVPLLFQDRNPVQLVTELLDDFQQEKRIKEVDILSQKMIAYLACRAAVKAGEPLTKKQCKDLLEKLEQTNNNSTCPHGRPTKIIIDIEKIHKMFKRK